MKYILFLFFTINSIVVMAQDSQEIILGKQSLDALMSEGWFINNSENYSVNLPEGLKDALKDKSIIAFVGNWCEDTQLLLPQFDKVMQALKFNKIEYVFVDRNKVSPENYEEGLSIKNIPTFIIYNNEKKEIGRIVEKVKETIELDLANIVLNKK